VTVEVTPHVSTNDTEGALAAAASDLGITSTTSWACRRELENGGLKRLLPQWETAELPVHAYFPSGRATRLAARTFVAFIADELRLNAP
jgi:DNA-binding transcriptional LysR family regulator